MVKFGDEPAEVSLVFQTDLGVLDGAPNLVGSSISAIKSDRQAFPENHLTEMVGHRDRGWVRSFRISKVSRHFRSFQHKAKDKTT